MDIIKSLRGREILDSRGNPTIEVDLETEAGIFRGAVPSGASTGSNEALEMRDGGDRYGGKGVLHAVEKVTDIIAREIIGKSVKNQEVLDRLLIELDGTEHKEKLGANSILAVSMAVARAGAAVFGMPLYSYLAKLSDSNGVTLPVPQLNVINGGEHAGIENDIQEHMIMPIGASSFREAMQISCEVYHCLRKLIKDKHGVMSIHLGDEGGFVPDIPNVENRLDLIVEAIEKTGYSSKVSIALDCAASEFYIDGKYHIRENKYNSEELISFYEQLINDYPIVSIEDGMHEEDWQGWQMLTEKLGSKIQIVGDDLFVTNSKIIQRGINEGSANSIILKINQIGTISESIDAHKLVTQEKWSVVVSHRSGETEDTFISDLVVGLDAGQSKFGAPARTDRNAKYNQLFRIEEELGGKARFAKFK